MPSLFSTPPGVFERNVWSVFGVPIDAITLDGAEARLRAAVETRQRLSFVTPNLNWLLRALRAPEAMQQIREADLSLADGAPVVWLARQLGAPVPERVAGSDLFDRLREKKPGHKPIRVFFFGGRAGAAEAANAKLNEENGGLVGCGALNPGYGSVEDMGAPVIFDTINRARPDFVLVSLGAAKGQAWISRYQHRVDAPVIAHLGAVVDFVGDTIRRAPSWMSRMGLEWAWRIYAEPALWRRYGADGLRLLGLIPSRLWTLQRDFRHMKDRGALDVEAERAGQNFRMVVRGNACAPDLEQLRPILKRALDVPGTVLLDGSGLGLVDGAFLGVLALLKSRLSARGRSLSIAGLDAVHADIFERMGLTDPIARAPQGQTDTVEISQGVSAE
ncbi:MAG: WecB/TagA/CpsF family glycosyltransferase [Hyphomonadaceae bacterium]|nr:WecB/TagA/CpsF family glycosyltransferase [Hyphomonadaceae bacterium]